MKSTISQSRFGGTLSGEHGDGLLRTPFLSRLYGEEIYSLFKKMKEIFDPNGILNPGKIIGEQATFHRP